MESRDQACGEQRPGLWRAETRLGRAETRLVESRDQAQGEQRPGLWRVETTLVESRDKQRQC